jgi:hypothetical protein
MMKKIIFKTLTQVPRHRWLRGENLRTLRWLLQLGQRGCKRAQAKSRVPWQFASAGKYVACTLNAILTVIDDSVGCHLRGLYFKNVMIVIYNGRDRK